MAMSATLAAATAMVSVQFIEQAEVVSAVMDWVQHRMGWMAWEQEIMRAMVT